MFERNEGRLRCQNRSEDETEFYNYISDALWYRLFPNGTVHEFGASGPVFVHTYNLYFHPFVRPEDQGIYYCCKPGGSCSGNSSVNIAGTYVRIYAAIYYVVMYIDFRNLFMYISHMHAWLHIAK